MSDWHLGDLVFPGAHLYVEVNRVLETRKSPFQDILLLDSVPFGPILYLDERVQSSALDEHIYHELLCHPAMLSHPHPETVLILGGGEGSPAREILRHASVKKVVMIDLDADVIEVCRKHRCFGFEAFEDSRFTLKIGDARVAIDNEGTFDVILSDLPDPLECPMLYTLEFFQRVREHLNPGGIFLTQSGESGILTHLEGLTVVHRTLREVFPKVFTYSEFIPCFGDHWGWNLCFSSPETEMPTSHTFDQMAKQRISGDLRFLDGEAFLRAMTLNKVVRKAIQDEQVISTDLQPFQESRIYPK